MKDTIYPHPGSVLQCESGPIFYVKQWSGSFASGVFYYNNCVTKIVGDPRQTQWVAVSELQGYRVIRGREKQAVIVILKLKGLI